MAEYEPVERFLDKRYDQAHMSKLKFNDSYEKAIHSWISRPGKFLVFLGRPGCGKTFAAIAITRFIFEQLKKINDYPTVFFYPQAKLLEEFKECYSNGDSDQTLKDRLCEMSLLTIDDFGCTRTNEWQIEIMTEIIDRRYNSLLPTILTSNLNFDEIAFKFHPRVRDRLEAKENLIIADWKTNFRKDGM